MQTEQQARDLATVFPDIVAERGHPFAVGDHVKAEPCKHVDELADPETPWQRAGRPCPRVDLRPELGDAARLAFALFHGSETMTPFLLSRPRRSRRLLFDRASEAISSPQAQALAKAMRESRMRRED